ncbi:MAG: hypothetical protein K8S99_04045 [Planctomycetes bacterium]|nr:hypothetical protein [Planctomycetota bacterium]
MSDDKHTRDTLDALAELYLTGTTPGKKPPTPPGSDPGKPDPLSGPRPIRMAPRLRPTPPATRLAPQTPATMRLPGARLFNPPPPKETASEGDDSPATVGSINTHTPAAPPLRLHREEAETVSMFTTAPAPRRGRNHDATLTPQAVFMGNLPGFGGPWLAQYAHYLARQGEAAVILHLEPDEADVELITAHAAGAGTGHGPSDNVLLAQWASDSVRLDLVELLDSLLHEAPVQVHDWLFHFTAGENEEIALRAAALGHWTWLCGADEAAVAAAARQMTAMLGVLDPADRPTLGVMVMGSDDDSAVRAAQQLDQAVRLATGVPVQLIGSQRQMGPVTLHRLGTFEEAAASDAAVSFAIDHLAVPVAVADAPLAEPATPTPAAPGTPGATHINDIHDPPAVAAVPVPDIVTFLKAPQPATPMSAAPVHPAAPPASTPAFSAPHPQRPQQPAQPAPQDAAATRPAPAPRPKAPPVTPPPIAARPSPSPRPAAPATPVPPPVPEPVASHTVEADADAPELVEFMLSQLPGAIALDAVCPRHPDTRLVLDQDGRLHLLCQHTTPGDLSAALVVMLESRAWAREHLALLRLTQRQLRFSDDAEPAMHLFTDQSRAATALITRLGDMVHVHLLQEVQLGDETAFLCTPLN